jgi:hypothetical protein
MVPYATILIVFCISCFLLGPVQHAGSQGAKQSKAKAPPHCKFFIWLVHLDRCWTSERLQRHNLQSNGPCALCSQEAGTIHHLLLSCIYAKEVWYKLLRRVGFWYLMPVQQPLMAGWWIQQWKRVAKELPKGLDTFVCLVCWSIWKERNARVFNNKSLQAARLVDDVREEGFTCAAAGFAALSDFIQ